jgi:hypothetical protein
MYKRAQGDKVQLGRVELDFTPEWVPDPACQHELPGRRGQAVEETGVGKIAVPRVRLSVQGSDCVIEIRDLERIQRLRRMTGRSRRVVLVNVR